MKPLYLFYEKRLVGEFVPDEALRMHFTYHKMWLEHKNNFPVSLSLPLQEPPHLYPKPNNFLENLLPEENIRRIIAQAFKVPESSPYLFLKEFGKDLAGAFVLSPENDPPNEAEKITGLPITYVDKAIDEGRTLYQSIAKDFNAKFSLAGAQDKFCVIFKGNEMYISQGSNPTTHIAKIDLDFRNSQSVYNEFFCMSLANAVGLNVPEVTLLKGKHPILLISRYDRKIDKDRVTRIHQEDFCQAQSMPSDRKYEERGGPSAKQNFDLIKMNSSQPIKDMESYLNWVAFNLMIGNNDTHTKNISFVYRGRELMLAPFYDLISTAIYGHRFDANFAIKIGTTFDYRKIGAKAVEEFESALGIKQGKFLKNFKNIAQKIEIHLPKATDQLNKEAPKATVGIRIEKEIEQRLKHFRKHSGLKI